jgi:predicted TIM-barrel fold metal-dependent hydrolase
MRIDCQSHVLPIAYLDLLERNPGEPKAIRKGAEYEIKYGDVQTFKVRKESYTIDRKLKDMDAANVDMSILSINIPGPEMLPTDLGVDGARICNDFLAEVTQRYPDRFMGLASLPLQDIPAALKEMDRALDTLGLRGVVLYSHVAKTPVDDASLEPFYQKVEERGVPIVLHPTVPTWGKAIQDYSMIPMVGMMVDHSFAMLRLILGGVLERHPRLVVVQPHLGGVLPYLMGRIENQTEVMKRGREHITHPPSAYYKRVYLDTVSPSSLALKYAYDFVGPDRLLFGSDHPWVSINLFLRLLTQMDIPAEDKAKIFGGNAQKLFGIS